MLLSILSELHAQASGSDCPGSEKEMKCLDETVKVSESIIKARKECMSEFLEAKKNGKTDRMRGGVVSED
jgi:hypothetical protein